MWATTQLLSLSNSDLAFRSKLVTVLGLPTVSYYNHSSTVTSTQSISWLDMVTTVKLSNAWRQCGESGVTKRRLWYGSTRRTRSIARNTLKTATARIGITRVRYGWSHLCNASFSHQQCTWSLRSNRVSDFFRYIESFYYPYLSRADASGSSQEPDRGCAPRIEKRNGPFDAPADDRMENTTRLHPWPCLAYACDRKGYLKNPLQSYESL